MRRAGVSGAAQDPDWVQKALRDLQRQIDQLRATLNGASATPSSTTPISGPAPTPTAILLRNMDGTYSVGSTVTVSAFDGTSSPATIVTRSF